MRVMQVFHRYLDASSNWIYNLLAPLNSSEIVIAAPIYINPEFIIDRADIVPLIYNLDPASKQNFIFNHRIRKNKKNIIKYLRNHRSDIDLVHAHFSFTGCEYLDICRELDKPLVVSFYGYDYENLPFRQPEWNKRYKDLFAGADAFLAEGPHGASLLEKIGCPSSKIYIQPLGVDLEKCRRDRPVTKPAGQLRLLQVANYKLKKGHRYTLQAFKKALAGCPDMRLTLVGSGDKEIETEIDNYIKNENFGSSVERIPFVSYSDLYTLLKQHDVLVQPSIYTHDHDSEGGAPVIIIEAQACGLPVISSFHADIPNVLMDGKTGLLCPEKDTRALSSAMTLFYNMDEDEFGKWSGRAVNYSAQNFDRLDCSSRLSEFYHAIVRSKK